jgi:hypothetical protein
MASPGLLSSNLFVVLEPVLKKWGFLSRLFPQSFPPGIVNNPLREWAFVPACPDSDPPASKSGEQR